MTKVRRQSWKSTVNVHTEELRVRTWVPRACGQKKNDGEKARVFLERRCVNVTAGSAKPGDFYLAIPRARRRIELRQSVQGARFNW